MSAPRYNLALTIGEDKVLPFTWTDKTKRPISIEGYSFECNLKSDATTLLTTLTDDDYITVVPASGRFIITFPRAITEQKITKFAEWDLWITTPQGHRKCLVKGSLTFSKP